MPRLGVLVALFLAALLAWAAVPAPAAAGGVAWLDYNTALAVSKMRGRPLMIYFHLPYCYRCQEMKRKVFSQAAVSQKLSREFIAAKVDLEKEPATGKLYGVDYTPSYLFLDPSGREVFRAKGVMGVERFLDMLDYVHGQAYQRQSLDQFMKGR